MRPLARIAALRWGRFAATAAGATPPRCARSAMTETRAPETVAIRSARSSGAGVASKLRITCCLSRETLAPPCAATGLSFPATRSATTAMLPATMAALNVASSSLFGTAATAPLLARSQARLRASRRARRSCSMPPSTPHTRAWCWASTATWRRWTPRPQTWPSSIAACCSTRAAPCLNWGRAQLAGSSRCAAPRSCWATTPRSGPTTCWTYCRASSAAARSQPRPRPRMRSASIPRTRAP
mmetsp:Transcript_32590/g.98503  ORF Transcript_32590/g.98503 Transcript_32590/m.98503 type:complete len:241 (-) Transcript_32590:82-804(-)